MTKYFIIFIFTLSSFDIFASRLKERDYFASLRSSKTNIRFGPGMNYDIKHVFRLKSMPIKVTAEYENWVEIEDFEGDDGWVNKNLITKRRTAMVKTDLNFINLHKSNFSKSKTILRLENNVILDMIKCIEDWCKIKVSGERGWVQKDEIWGWKRDKR
ncbi:SH3 domain-containing protein [Rickettsiales bacterium]|nr:SH3 domain-containing protein [Rickettsiales bacterium]MDB2550277.1 SH3 domain-containing protein [Rickettsiales bacterium]